MSILTPTRKKQPSEARYLPFEFAGKLATGDTVAGASVPASVTADTGITVGVPQASGDTKVIVLVSEGTVDQNYRVNCLVDTVLGETLELDAIIQVREGVN